MRANWKLLVENSMDGYHAAFTHERFFTHFMPAMGLEGRTRMPLDGRPSPSPISPTIPLGNGHVTTGYPSPAVSAKVTTISRNTPRERCENTQPSRLMIGMASTCSIIRDLRTGDVAELIIMRACVPHLSRGVFLEMS